MSKFTPIKIDILGEIRGIELYEEFYALYCDYVRSGRVTHFIRDDSNVMFNLTIHHIESLNALEKFCKNKQFQVVEAYRPANNDDDKFCDSMLE
jgi:hypothetical protein